MAVTCHTAWKRNLLLGWLLGASVRLQLLTKSKYYYWLMAWAR
jgi:hypothetical protein